MEKNVRYDLDLLFRKNLWNRASPRKALAFSIVSLALLPVSGFAQARYTNDGDQPTRIEPINYTNVIRIGPKEGVKGDLAHIVRKGQTT